MKRIPFYRRPGKQGKFTGLKERVIWMINKRGRPVTGTEISEVFGVTLAEFNLVARTLTRGGGQVAKIVTSEPWITETGHIDRHFALAEPAKVVLPKNSKTRLFTRKSVAYSSKNMREQCIEKAERRKRLIAAGLYIDEFEAVL